jgi:hypothetical protein
MTVADISKDVESQLPEICNKCVYYSLTVDESRVNGHHQNYASAYICTWHNI